MDRHTHQPDADTAFTWRWLPRETIWHCEVFPLCSKMTRVIFLTAVIKLLLFIKNLQLFTVALSKQKEQTNKQITLQIYDIQNMKTRSWEKNWSKPGDSKKLLR